MTIEEFFDGRPEAERLFEAVRALIDEIGPAEMRVTRSQVAFRRRTEFAFLWTPDRYLRRTDVPLVLTIGLRRHHPSPRWKQVVEPAPGRFTHHLELWSIDDVDDEVGEWLREAWADAG